MTTQEASKLLFIIRAEYPESFRNFTTQDFQNKAMLWADVLADYSYEEASAGLQIFMTSDKKGWAPKASQIIDCIQKHLANSELESTTTTAYVARIRWALRNSTYHAQEEYDALPEICKRAVGSPENLREWGQLEEEKLETVIMSQIIKSLDAARIRMREEARIPASVRIMIQQKDAEKLIENSDRRLTAS